MFGLKDGGIIAAYLLCFASVITCVVYGIRNWNKGGEASEEDKNWGKEEEKIDREFE